MKNIKKLKSYGKAVAGSALLVGATLTGAAGLAAAQSGSSGDATLHDYPTPFVDDEGNVDTSIVVGSSGQQADVVSAVDIAGDLGNNAFEETTVSGGSGSVAGFDGETEDELIPGETVQLSADKSDYSALARTTLEADDGDDVFVTESISAGMESDIDNTINETETEFRFGEGAIEYSSTYSPGFEAGDDIYFLGEEYELVEVVDTDEVELGSTVETTLDIGGSYTHGPYTVEVTGQSSGDSPEAVVRVSDGESTIETQALEDDEVLELDNDQEVDDTEFSVEATSVVFYEGQEGAEISLESTVQDTTLEEGEDLPMDDNYEVTDISVTGGNDSVLSGVTVANTFQTAEDPEDDDEIAYVESGESVEGPAGMFSLYNQGLANEATTDVEFEDDTGVTFEDVNNQEHSFDMTELVSGNAPEPSNDENYIGVPGPSADQDGSGVDYFPVEVGETGGTVELIHNEFEEEFDVSNAQNTFTVSGGSNSNYDGYATGDPTSGDYGVAYRTVDTGYGFSVTIEWVNDGTSSAPTSAGDVDEVNFYNGDYDATSSADEGSEDVAAQARVTTENGAEMFLTNGNEGTVATGSNAETFEVPSHVEGDSSNEIIVLDEDIGDSDVDPSGETGEHVAVVYDSEDGSAGYDDADDGEIGEVAFLSDVIGANSDTNTPNDLTDLEDGESALTNFGSAVELNSESSVNVMYPDDQRYSMAALGSDSGSTGGSTGDATSMMPTGFPSGTATLDEDVSNSERDQNMILVGGPEVNGLTADLASEGQTWNSSEYESNQGVGVLDLVNDAFSDGYSALVVAGWEAEDTTAAADYLVDYNPETDTALDGRTTAQVNTDSGELVE